MAFGWRDFRCIIAFVLGFKGLEWIFPVLYIDHKFPFVQERGVLLCFLGRSTLSGQSCHLS